LEIYSQHEVRRSCFRTCWYYICPVRPGNHNGMGFSSPQVLVQDGLTLLCRDTTMARKVLAAAVRLVVAATSRGSLESLRECTLPLAARLYSETVPGVARAAESASS
jgi:hypothetical protein